MNIEFKIEKQILERLDSSVIINNSRNVYSCVFSFNDDLETSSLWDGNKFVIFRDSWGNAKTVFLGTGLEDIHCSVPKSILEGTFFVISLYAEDLTVSTEVIIPLKQSMYISHSIDDECDQEDEEKDIFVDIFDKINTKIEDVEFSENCLKLYKNNELIKSICFDFVNEVSVRSWLQEYSDEFNTLLDGKADSLHHHTVDDVLDFEDRTSVEVKASFRQLADRIRGSTS